ncbi:ComEA family DNA-binding protein [Lactobacillus delbrueckii subsp. lactis]|uniref:helix-hairpin-helix domain-containing protein n=1 Tax=Lactobacillus delbrueckii TaxID=1584 RepID=UPI0004AC33C0|nr:helix-hairpin-helix domain-containing protein [Lactobacillus delbrueckii]MCD5514976.1 helix-hairpin-helix domain-containing protein [Lactobacillus delbrueckii subsp. lactis]MCD5520834.1 helix-hairpin-helix domain-containing protein [Lactobacillus delbrueckii subsp. lactis]MCT0002608.1 ComEA family DNA-binding protein [Lactobacillus delbrueckii subsp. lactis]MCT3484081.1 ComEA family DNA-binding protein [Lactobacillus delbrueckii subsp. lactis]MCT3487652.1 ComEA family DNA-binding protein [L
MNQSNERTEGKQKLQDLLAWLMDKKMYIVVVLLAAGGFYYANRQPAADNSALLSSSQSMSENSGQSSSVSSVAASASSAASAANAEVVCDISGAVKHQGVYRLKNGARLEDLIEKAGGLTKDAQLQAINRSQLLKDQDKIYIPGKGDKMEAAQTANSAAASAPASSTSASASASSVSSSTSGAASGDLINLNTATASDLQKLNGIGEKKAEQIIAYRQEKGSFKSIDELKEVSGIGDKTFAAIKDQLTI